MTWDASSQILTSSTITSSSQSTAIDPDGAVAPSGLVLAQMWVGVVTGTNPALTVYIEESTDNSTWYEAGKFEPCLTNDTLVTDTKTTTDQYQCVFNRTRRYIRARWVVGGTGSPTFNTVYIHSRALGYQIPAVPSAT